MHEVLEELAILAIVVHACTAFPKPRRSSSHCSSEATGSGTLRSEAAEGPLVCLHQMISFLLGSLPFPTPSYSIISTITPTIRSRRCKPLSQKCIRADCMSPRPYCQTSLGIVRAMSSNACDPAILSHATCDGSRLPL